MSFGSESRASRYFCYQGNDGGVGDMKGCVDCKDVGGVALESSHWLLSMLL